MNNPILLGVLMVVLMFGFWRGAMADIFGGQQTTVLSGGKIDLSSTNRYDKQERIIFSPEIDHLASP